MRGFVKNATASLALAGLVLSQPALAAGPAHALPSSGATTKTGRVSSGLGAHENIAGFPIVGVILALAITAAIIAVIASDSSESKSPVSP